MSDKTIRVRDLDFEPYISSDAVREQITQLAGVINKDYAEVVCPLLLITLSGGIVFGGELFRQLSGDVEIGFVKLSSYGDTTRSSGSVRVDVAPTVDVADRDVIIVEDVVDTGNTIEVLTNMLTQAGARSVKVATLLIKRDVYKKDLPIDYVGFESENIFIIGYGLDYGGLGRNLDGIYKVVK